MAEVPFSKADMDKVVQMGDMDQLAGLLKNYPDKEQLTNWYKDAGYLANASPGENARQIIRHIHCFNSWAEYEHFQIAIQDTNSALWQFEQVADAIASGDYDTIKSLLHKNPDLIHMRSVRNHHSTLLNYIGANGFEGFRQKTPKNASAIARLLLESGAEVDAWGDMYRGTSTLGLVATSVHPVITGVQQEIMEVLIEYGADPNHAVAPDYTDGILILACLHNGRCEPIKYLAEKGAYVDLEAAGGVDDLEKVKSYFNTDGRLSDDTLKSKLDACFIWACDCGNMNIIEYLLEKRIDVNTRSNGMTALHSAAFGGHPEIVKLLLDRKADMEAINAYGGTVLSQTLWCLYNHKKLKHSEIMEMLISAGAHIKEEWQRYIDDQRHSIN
ncbi:MAG TPA: ankyrin repeat domain-containing protein [Mucilaginibacter sp.]